VGLHTELFYAIISICYPLHLVTFLKLLILCLHDWDATTQLERKRTPINNAFTTIVVFLHHIPTFARTIIYFRHNTAGIKFHTANSIVSGRTQQEYRKPDSHMGSPRD